MDKKGAIHMIVFILVILVFVLLGAGIFSGHVGIRSPVSNEFFITDKGNDCSRLEPPTHYKDGDNQGKYIGTYLTPKKALWTSVDTEHPWYSDYYKTCNAHNLQFPIGFI